MLSRRATSQVIARLLGRFERSQRVFFAGLLIAFSVEIVVDWNSTFYEINVLRASLRDKGTNYAAMLRLAAQDPLEARDLARLRRLSHRILVDEEIAFVRVINADGGTVVEAGADLPTRFPKQIVRDQKMMLADPAALREAIAGSPHRDVFQAVTDGEDRLIRALTRAGPAPLPRVEQEVAYQDRLYDERTRAEERAITWALAVVEAPRSTRAAGVVLIALKADHLNAAIRKKLYKGSAVTLFFLAVILVQQLSARRAKLRLLSMSDALAAPRAALAATLPPSVPTLEGVESALALEQAERLGGTIYDFHVDPERPRELEVFVAQPEGSGVDVAFAALLIRDRQRRLQRDRPTATAEERLAALLAGYAEEPIHRRFQLALFRVDLAAGEVRGVLGGMSPPAILDRDGANIAARLEPMAAGSGAELVDGALYAFRAPLPESATLLVFCDGRPAGAHHPLRIDEAVDHVRGHVRGAAGRRMTEVVESLRALAVKRAGKTPSEDILVMLLHRSK